MKRVDAKREEIGFLKNKDRNISISGWSGWTTNVWSGRKKQLAEAKTHTQQNRRATSITEKRCESEDEDDSFDLTLRIQRWFKQNKKTIWRFDLI